MVLNRTAKFSPEYYCSLGASSIFALFLVVTLCSFGSGIEADRELEFVRKALEAAELLKDEDTKFLPWCEIAEYYGRQGNYDQAKWAAAHLQDEERQAACLTTAARVIAKFHGLDAAIRFAESLAAPRARTKAYLGVGDFAVTRHNFDVAGRLLSKMRDLGAIAILSQRLARVQATAGDYEGAQRTLDRWVVDKEDYNELSTFITEARKCGKKSSPVPFSVEIIKSIRTRSLEKSELKEWISIAASDSSPLRRAQYWVEIAQHYYYASDTASCEKAIQAATDLTSLAATSNVAQIRNVKIHIADLQLELGRPGDALKTMNAVDVLHPSCDLIETLSPNMCALVLLDLLRLKKTDAVIAIIKCKDKGAVEGTTSMHHWWWLGAISILAEIDQQAQLMAFATTPEAKALFFIGAADACRELTETKKYRK